MRFELPTRLKDSLALDPGCASVVEQFASRLAVLLGGSSFSFFPEYTDHGVRHVQATLDAADWLITEDAYRTMTPESAAILCLAVMVHDIALAFTETSFLSLLKAQPASRALTGFAERPWADLWHEFLMESTRWDSRTRNALLGGSLLVEAPGTDPLLWTEAQKRLIGEFIRRHHPRIAHETILFGLAGAKDEFPPPAWLDGIHRQLVGLIARSHGMRLRDTFAPLQSIIGQQRAYGHVYPIYLMALLRIADYLDVEAARAPRLQRKLKGLRSPFSRREWNMHDGIGAVSVEDDDREAVYVHAFPKDLKTFLRTADLLKDLQAELDTSWAVLGEMYSRVKPELGLTLRRVRSTLDNLEEFRQRVSYVPVRAELRSAGSDLLKLLIKPLYGNNPAAGVRELTQNAVDAVFARRRLDVLEGQHLSDQAGKVIVRLVRADDGRMWIEFIDDGIGMDLDTIQNYFLTAGARVRKNETWKRLNMEGDSTAIVFSGRFGVGVLGGFILGDELEVATRHVHAPPPDGIGFSVTIDDDVVELARVECSVGTRIRIKLTESAARALVKSPTAWDWYCFQLPRVLRVMPDGEELDQKWNVPSPDGSVADGWERFSPSGFTQVDWTYARAPGLVCNGFLVSEKRLRDELRISSLLKVQFPNISVIDKNANLPLRMDREGLTEELPFERELELHMATHYLARIMQQAPTRYDLADADVLRWLFHPLYEGEVNIQRCRFARWILDRSGFLPVDPWNVSRVDIDTLFLVGYDPDVIPLHLDIPGPVLLADVRNNLGGVRAFVDEVLYPLIDQLNPIGSFNERRSLVLPTLPKDVFSDLGLYTLQVILPQQDVEEFEPRMGLMLQRYFAHQTTCGKFTCFSTAKDTDPVEMLAEQMNIRGPQTPPRAIVRLVLRKGHDRGPKVVHTPLSAVWAQLFTEPTIAFARPKREMQLRQIHDELAMRI